MHACTFKRDSGRQRWNDNSTIESTHSGRRQGGGAEEEHKHVATIQRVNAGESVTGLITSLITTRPAQSALILASVSIREGCIVDGFRETVARPRAHATPGKLVSRIEHRVQFVAIEDVARGLQLHRRHHTLPPRR